MPHTIHTFLCSVLLLCASLDTVAALSNEELSLDPLIQTKQIKGIIKDVFADLGPSVVAKMISIADCESYGGADGLIMHIDPSGKIVKNPTTPATGVFQIMLRGSGFTPLSKKLGLELLEVEDNVKFARVLVDDKIERKIKNIYSDWVCA